MPQLKMTDLAVKSATAEPGERIDYFDAHPRDRQRGLVLRVSRPEGGELARSWCVLYRIKGSTKLRRHTIGEYPSYSLARAREEAAAIVQAARRGEDLAGQREAQARAQAAKERDTVEQISKRWLTDWRERPKRRGGKRSAEYLDKLDQYLDKHILPQWRGRHLGEIRRADVDDLVSEIARVKKVDGKATGGPVVANRCLAAVKAMFNWAIRRELIEANPATLVEKPGAETARERVLTTDEIASVWAAFKGLPYPFGHFFRLALLTAQRREEVAGMEWSELDLEAEVPTWTIPATRTKAHRTQVVPLSAEALAVIEELKAYRRKDVSLLFTTNGTTPISGFSRAKRQIDDVVAKARKEAELDPVAHWTVHDLRRTAATEMSKLGTSRFVVARVLNHVDTAVTGRYDRNEYLAEKKAALARWAAYLLRVVNPKSAKVASLQERRRAESASAA